MNNLLYMSILLGLLKERVRMQRLVHEKFGKPVYGQQSKYQGIFKHLEWLIEEHLELIDDQEYESVLNVPFHQWEIQGVGN